MLHPTMKAIAEFVVSAYSFLLPFGRTVSGSEYADIIGHVYDTENPSIKCDCEVSRRYIKSIVRQHGVIRAVYAE